MEKVKRQESLFTDSITVALWEMMAEKPFKSISVSELVTRAGVGRVTFYRNFKSMEEVLQRSLQHKMSQQLNNTSLTERDWSDDHLETTLRQFFDLWYQEREPIRLLLTNQLDYLLENELNHYFQKRLGQLTDQFHLQFIVGGFFRVLKTWVAGGCQENPETIMSIITSSR